MSENQLRLEDNRVALSTVAAWAGHLGVDHVDPDELRTRLGQGSLPEAFAATAAKTPHAPALTIDGETLSHADIDGFASRAASGFKRIGVGAGGVVMIVADTTLSHVVAYLGNLRLGATIVPVHPSLTASELAAMAAASGASWVVGSGGGLQTCREAELAGVVELVGLDSADRSVASVLLDELATGEEPVRTVHPDSPALVAFTSGTTGRPKAAPLSHRNVLTSTRGAMWAWRWSQADHLVHSLPLSHQHGLSGVHATLLAGSRATLLPRFDADELVKTISDKKATILFGVPAIHQRLLDELGERIAALGTLRFSTSGSGPLSVETAMRFERAVGQPLLERYGTTESGLNVSNRCEGPRIPGSVGFPLPGVEVALADGGEVVPAGEQGEVLIRGPQVFGGYLDVTASDQPFLHGWFRTGDIGVVDEGSGHLRLLGREKDVIISGGMNVYPREVENVIRQAPGVTDTVVVGVDSERWGEEVVALVCPVEIPGHTIDELLRRNLAPYKRPKRIVAVAEIPRSALGKILRDELVRLATPSDSGDGLPDDVASGFVDE